MKAVVRIQEIIYMHLVLCIYTKHWQMSRFHYLLHYNSQKTAECYLKNKQVTAHENVITVLSRADSLRCRGYMQCGSLAFDLNARFHLRDIWAGLQKDDYALDKLIFWEFFFYFQTTWRDHIPSFLSLLEIICMNFSTITWSISHYSPNESKSLSTAQLHRWQTWLFMCNFSEVIGDVCDLAISSYFFLPLTPSSFVQTEWLHYKRVLPQTPTVWIRI